MSGNGWKIFGCLCAATSAIAIGGIASSAVKHCSDEKTERDRIDYERCKYVMDSKDRRAKWDYDLECKKLGEE